MISYDDFAKLELKVAQVKNAERVESTDKLLRLELDLGGESRQIISGIGKEYEPGSLIGKQIVVLANLEPKTFRGLESQGMLLAAVTEDDKAILLVPEKSVTVGSRVK